MFRNNKLIKKISAGLIAGFCTFSMLTTAMSGVITAHAASVDMESFPSADEVIAQAATLLGTPYEFGRKGYSGVYKLGEYEPLSEEYIRGQGIDCSGLVYYTMTHLGYSTSGFDFNNPNPVDCAHWFTVNDNCTITYKGITSKIDVEKKNVSTNERPYWQRKDGSTITPGAVVVAENTGGIDHAWIYMGEFDSRDDVVNYLKSIGVPNSLMTSKTVGDGNGDGGKHWRIESNGSEGVVINNETDGKKASAMNMYAFRITTKEATFSIRKVNSKTGEIIGESPVDNSSAVYGVYTDKNCTEKVGEITIGSDGKGSIVLPTKNYYVKEIKAPTGYALSPTIYKLVSNSTVDVTEEELTGTININKTSEDGNVSGRTFKIVGSDGKVYTKSTDVNGVASFTDLPVYNLSDNGEIIMYTVSEINVPVCYEVPKAQNISFVNGTTVDLVKNTQFHNALKSSEIRIVKKDSETGKIISKAGIGFKIWNCDKKSYVIDGVNDTFYTDESGTATLSIKLKVGDYELHEVKSASGYALDSKPVPFKVDGSVATVVVEKTNTAQKGRISILKQGDMFVSVNTNGEFYEPVFGLTGLMGAEYEITAAEDIMTADGTIRAKKGEVVSTLTTDKNGFAESDLLYLGKYEIAEVTAPFGFVKNDTIQTVELVYEGQEVEVRDTVNKTFLNDYQDIEITLSKVMERDELFGIGLNEEYLSACFGLYADEEIIAEDGSCIPANGKIAELSLGEDMTAKFNAQIPFGRYYVQEIATDEHYILNGEKYLINFEYMGQEITTVSIDCGQFTNELKRGNANGYKVNENDEPLANAVFGLFSIDTTEFTENTVIMTAVSDENGFFEFNELVCGEFLVKEITPPSGYIISDKIYPVTINENGDTVEIVAENKAITVEISKQDIYGKELAGTEMQLTDLEGNIIDEWISNGTNHVISELEAGEYILKEITPPEGYAIATDIVFKVFADGSAIVENVDKIAITENGYPLIIMIDEAIPEVPEIPDKPPVTGYSDNNFMKFILVGFVIAFLLTIVRRKIRLNRR